MVSLQYHANIILEIIRKLSSPLSYDELSEIILQNVHDCTRNIYLAFVNDILLKHLHDTLNCYTTVINSHDRSLEHESKSEALGSSNPTNTLLSINQLRAIYTSLELIWCWGIKPFLHESGYHSIIDVLPKSILVSDFVLNANMNQKEKYSPYDSDDKVLYDSIACILDTSTCLLFKYTMLERSMPRILYSLLFLSSRNSIDDHLIMEKRNRFQCSVDIERNARLLLMKVMEDGRIEKNILISEMRGMLSEKQQVVWIRKMIPRLMTTVLLSSGGLEAVITSFLGDTADVSGESNVVSVQRVSRVLTSIPTHIADPEIYISCLAIQLLPLLRRSVKSSDNVTSNVLAVCVNRFAELHQDITARLILRPLLQPVLCGTNPDTKYNLSNSTTAEPNIELSAVSQEGAVDETLDLLRVLSSVCPLTSAMLSSYFQANVMQDIVVLTLQVLHCYPVSGSLSKLVRLVDIFVKGMSTTEASELFFDCVKRLATADMPRYDLSLGPSGGVRIGPCLSCDKAGSDMEIEKLSLFGKVLCDLFVRMRWASSLPADRKYDSEMGGVAGGESLEALDVAGASYVSSLFVRLLALYYDAGKVGSTDGGDSVTRGTAAVLVLQLQNTLAMSTLLHNGEAVLSMLLLCLQNQVDVLRAAVEGTAAIEAVVGDTEEESTESTLESCVCLLSTMLSLGAPSRSAAEDALIQQFVRPLQSLCQLQFTFYSQQRYLTSGTFGAEDPTASTYRISSVESVEETYNTPAAASDTLGQSISDLLLLVLRRCTRSVDSLSSASEVNSSSSSADDASTTTPETEVQKVIRSAYTNLRHENAGVRALGVSELVAAIRSPNEALTDSDVSLVALQCMELLSDKESYVYLAAVHALAFLLSRHGRVLLRTLLDHFAGGQGHSVDREVSATLPHRQRALLGEAVCLWLRGGGSAGDRSIVGPLIAVCVRVARGRRDLLVPNSTSTVTVDLQKFRIQEIETQTDIPKDHNKQRPPVPTVTLSVASVAESADRVLLRQSALSLLAEAVVAAGFGAAPYLADIVDVATGVLVMELGGRQEDRACHRACAFILRHIVSHLGGKMLLEQIKGGSSQLKLIQRTLRNLIKRSGTKGGDVDDVTIFHTSVTLDTLDALVYSNLDATQQPVTTGTLIETCNPFLNKMLRIL